MNFVKARWNPVYIPCATHRIIAGYNVYAYVGHPLLGEVMGTHHFVKTKAEAMKIAKELRHIKTR